MDLTLVEKIVAGHCGRAIVRPGDAVEAGVDVVALDEDRADAVRERLESSADPGIQHPGRVALLPDRFVASSDGVRAGVYRRLTEFAKRWGIEPPGPAIARGGLLPVELLDRGLALPGGLVVSSDVAAGACGGVGCLAVCPAADDLVTAVSSGTVRLDVPASIRWRFQGMPGRWCSGTDVILHALRETSAGAIAGRAIEMLGPVVDRATLVERLAMAAIVVGAGAAIGFCYPDEAALAWLRARTAQPLRPLLPDADAAYEGSARIALDGLEPMVAPADSPCSGKRLSELAEVSLDQVVIGARSGGRVEDLRMAARLLKEHNVHAAVRLVIIPGNQRAYLHAVDEGLVATFLRSGALVAAPSSGLWEEASPGTLGAGERCLATSATSGVAGVEVYLASPAVAAASAVMGRIAHPDEVLRSRREPV